MASNMTRTSSSGWIPRRTTKRTSPMMSLRSKRFGTPNFCAQIAFAKTSAFTSTLLSSTFDFLLWYSKDKPEASEKYQQIYEPREPIENPNERYICVETARGEIIDLSVAQKTGK